MAKFLLSISIVLSVLSSEHLVDAIYGGTFADHFKGRLGVALVDSRTADDEYIQCSGALISQKHVLTSRLCCYYEPVVILGSTIAYDEYGERFRTVKHCWVGKKHRLIYTQMCLLTLARKVIFRETLQPYVIPVKKNDYEYNVAGRNLRAFGFGSTIFGEIGINDHLMTTPLTRVHLDECRIGDTGFHECAVGTDDNKLGQLNYNDIGGPITTSIDLELFALAGCGTIPREEDGRSSKSIILPIAKIRDELLEEMANTGDKCLHNN